jgi:hypothetical protein
LKVWALAMLVGFAVWAGTAPTASADTCPADPGASPSPCELQVLGGEDAWHPDYVFGLRWRNPVRDGGPPIAAVHMRVLDPSGQPVLAEKQLDWDAESVQGLPVPNTPGIYTAEVWLEDAAGGVGPPATAKLRFDDARPGSVDPMPAPSWIGRPAFPYRLRLGHPADPQPLSGIRGFAIAVDRSASGDPCVAADRCTQTETDLRGGAGEDTLSLSELPEGTSYVHVVAVSGSGMRSATVGRSVLRVDTTDPVTALAGAPRSWTNHPVRLLASATDAASGMSPAPGAPNPFTAIQVDGGAPVVVPGDSAQASVVSPGVHSVAYYARDAAGNVDDGGSTNGHPNLEPMRATVRIDTEPPSVAFSNAQNPRDPEAIEARLRDPLSGLDGGRGQIEVRPAGSNDRFEALPTIAAGERLLAHWDSDAYRPGRYEFRATAHDRAGNSVATQRRANGEAVVLPAPLRTPTRLRAALVGRFARSPLAFGRGALLSGRLIAGRRAPLGAMRVRVVERFEVGSSEGERVSTMKTDALGGFTLRLAPGPSRQISADFAGTETLSRSRSAPFELEAQAGVRLRASAPVARVGGRPVVFQGSVATAGAEIPVAGKYVQIQFRAAGVPWTELRTVATDGHGRFRCAYRFSDDDSRGVRFQFRAYAPAQSDWPYEAGASRPVAVRGI